MTMTDFDDEDDDENFSLLTHCLDCRRIRRSAGVFFSSPFVVARSSETLFL